MEERKQVRNVRRQDNVRRPRHAIHDLIDEYEAINRNNFAIFHDHTQPRNRRRRPRNTNEPLSQGYDVGQGLSRN
jgi:hypothetical protein